MFEALSHKQILDYEIGNSWWAPWVGWDPLQELASRYFAWKVKRKRLRYILFMHKRKKHELSGS